MTGEDLFKGITFEDESGLIEIENIQKEDANEKVSKPNEEKEEFIEIDDNLEIETSTGNGSSAGSQTSSPFSSLANAFVVRGHLPSDDEILKKFIDVKDMEEFLELYEENRIDTLESNLTDDQKEYLESIKIGIPQGEIEKYISTIKTIDTNFSNENLSNDDVAKVMMLNYYMLVKGNEQEEAAALAEVALTKSNKDELLKDKRNELRKFFETKYEAKKNAGKAEQAKSVESEKQRVEDLKKFVFEKELFPSVKLSDQMKSRIINTATKIVGESKDGKPLNAVMKAYEDNPIETLSKLSYIWEMTNGLKNLSGFNAKAMTAATNAVTQISNKPTLTGAYEHTPEMRERVKQTGNELVTGLKAALGL
jgi:hypothetical protein